MADDLPVPRSQPQILGDMLRSFAADTGIRRLRTGGPLLSVFEAASRSDSRDLAHVFEAAEAQDLDNQTGRQLARTGTSEDLPPLPALRATATLTVSDTSFAKVSSRVYRGSPAPVIGTVSLRVDDASLAPASGVVYVGRGTAQSEGPLTYASKTQGVGYWQLNLSTPTARFHNWGEEVVVGHGGDRVADVGQLVATPQGALTPTTQFLLTQRATLLDGEVELAGVSAVCTVDGTGGNVLDGSITEWVGGPPFPGAAVTNPDPVTSGMDVETDDQYRDRIRGRRGARTLGAGDLALENAVLRARAPDEDRVITSAQLVRRRGAPAKLHVDDGSGYEAKTVGVALEVLVDSATGGEFELETQHRPVAKAYLLAGADAPYGLAAASVLTVQVGGKSSSHAFDATQITAGAASAYEVASSINSDPSCLFEARTVRGGSRFVLEARAETGEDLLLDSPDAGLVDANGAFQLPAGSRKTTWLYVDDRPLSKDGRPAALAGLPFSRWDHFAGPQTLTVAVNGTPPVTYTVTDQMFIDARTGYAAVGRNTPAAWSAVLSRLLPGVSVPVDRDHLVLTSDRAGGSVEVLDCDLVARGVFQADSNTGVADDYDVDRPTGDLTLVAPLARGRRLTLGTAWPQAFVESGDVPTTTLAADQDLWIAVDANASVVPHGVTNVTGLASTILRAPAHAFHLQLAAQGPSPAFRDVQAGDWMVATDPGFPAALRGSWRVLEVLPDDDSLPNRVVVERRAAALGRVGHTATVLPDGKVLVAGGYTTDTQSDHGHRVGRGTTDAVEVYDPSTGAWAFAAPMTTPRANHTSTALQSGKILVAGGVDRSGAPLASGEVYDQTSDTWTPVPGGMATARTLHTATLLTSGRVLLAGGKGTSGAALAAAEEYDPTSSGSFINPTTMGTARWGHQAVLLPPGAGTAGAEAGNVLVLGGHTNAATRTNTVERYAFVGLTWASRAGMPLGSPPGADGARAFFGAAVVDTQHVLVIGDEYQEDLVVNPQNAGSYAVYAADSDSWASKTLLPGGRLFYDKDVLATAQGILAPHCFDPNVAPLQPQVHVRYAGGVWADVAPSLSFQADVHRVETRLVAAGGGVVVVGGSAVDNFQVAFPGDVNDKLAVTVATPEFLFHSDHDEWETPDPAALASFTLLDLGLTFVRTPSDLHRVTVPSGANYTAVSLAAALGFDGLSSAVYRTRRIRLSSNTRGGGDLLVAASTLGAALPLSNDPQSGDPDTGAAVATGRSDATPAGFQVYHGCAVPDTEPDAPLTIHAAEPAYDLAPDPAFQLFERELPPPPAGTIVGLRRWHDGPNPSFWQFPPTIPLDGDDPRLPEQGNVGLRAVISTYGYKGDVVGGLANDVALGLRAAPRDPVAPHQPFVVGQHLSTFSTDEVTLVVDGDEGSGRFTVPAARKLSTVGAYAQTVSLRDAGGADALWKVFGTDYDFDDFAVHMRARAKTHDGDANRRILWRWLRPGPEGNAAILRYAYADGPDAPVSARVRLDQDDPTTDLKGRIRANVDVLLPSGPSRTLASIPADARVAFARTNPDTAGQVWDVWVALGFQVIEADRASSSSHTRLRLQVPNPGSVALGPAGAGVNPGDSLWLEVTTPSGLLFSGAFAVENVDAFNSGTGTQDIYVPPFVLNDGGSALSLTSNPGTVSFSSTRESTFDPTIVAGDLFRDSGAVAVPGGYAGTTGRVVALGRQFLRVRSLDIAGVGNVPSFTAYPVPSGTGLDVFGGPTQTAGAVAAAVNALDGRCPVSATVTGTGTGVLSMATWDEANDAPSGAALKDGLNYVQRTTPPPTPSDETTLLLRLPVDSNLVAGSADWAHEDVWILPVLPHQVAQWLTTPPVTGLSTRADVAVADDGHRVRVLSKTLGSAGSVQVQGGAAVAASAALFGSARVPARPSGHPSTCVAVVRRAEGAPLLAGSWVAVDHGEWPKSPTFWDSSATVTVDPAGRWTLNASPYGLLKNLDNLRVHFEVVGDYVALHVPKACNKDTFFPGQCVEFGYVYVTSASGVIVGPPPNPPASELPAVAGPNRGVFPVVRFTLSQYGSTIWIRNPGAVSQVALAHVKTLAAYSPVPGDTWSVGTDRFGAANRGDWTISEVGAATPGGEQYVDLSWRVYAAGMTPGTVANPTSFDVDAARIQLRRAPGRMVKQVLSITPNQDDPEFTDVQLDTAEGAPAASAATGARLVALDKLAFPTDPAVGRDGYAYHAGLIGEANRILYGDDRDEATYPGYAASGAKVLVVPPRIRRAVVALSIRVKTGFALGDVADRVRSGVAASINSAGVGEPRALNDLLTAAGKVPGVVAASMVSPAMTSTSDLLEVSPGERLRVLDLRRDVTVTFVGES